MSGTDRFEDRTDAGEQLAGALVDRDIGADVVLTIPRGGLPLGRVVLVDDIDEPEPVEAGYGDGSFVGIRATRPS